MKPRVLVAGVGNIFFGDDAFGPAVLSRLTLEPPAGTRCEDFGIRGLHLAYELLSGYSAAILVDAVARGGAPGTLYVIEPSEPPAVAAAPDAHRMDLGSVFGFVAMLGGTPPPITIVGCEPESLGEGEDLSPVVERAVATAIALVRRLANKVATTTEEQACEV